MKRLAGKIALVTGGSRGAGRGIAVELGKAGAVVYVSGRSLRGTTTHGFPGSIDETVDRFEVMEERRTHVVAIIPVMRIHKL